MKRPGVVYRLTFPNGKVYIGITREGLGRRIKRHIAYARAGKHFALSAAIRKYGEGSFSAEVVSTADTLSDLKAMEIALIDKHNALGAGGYNMTGGGDGSLMATVPDATRRKIGNSLTGREFSEQHRRRLSEVQRGKVIPQDVRDRMSAAAKERCARSPMSDEQRELRRQALLGKKRGPYRKRTKNSVTSAG